MQEEKIGMADPYWRYSVPPSEGETCESSSRKLVKVLVASFSCPSEILSTWIKFPVANAQAACSAISTPKPRFPGHLSSDVSTLTTHHQWSSNDVPGSSDFRQKDFQPSHPGAYGIDGIGGIYPESSGGGGLTSGVTNKGYPSPLRDPSFLRQGRDVTPGISASIDGRIYERSKSLRRGDGLPVAAGESNILFVDGLPTDCSRRESGEKAMVLCFVEFADARCAHTAMETLQESAVACSWQ